LSRSTLHYRSPEMLLGYEGLDTSTDIWSIGCILAELVLRQVLFQGSSVFDQLDRIIEVLGKPDSEDVFGTTEGKNHIACIDAPQSEGSENVLTQLFSSKNSLLADLLSRMLKFNYEKRISALEAMRHPYFKPMHRESNITWSPKQFTFELSDEMMDAESLKEELYRLIVKTNNGNIARRLDGCEDH
jgi:serine/threonine protein kinase